MVSLSGSIPWLSPPQVRVAEILRDTLGELLLLPEEAARRVIYMRDIYMLTSIYMVGRARRRHPGGRPADPRCGLLHI